MKVILLQDIYKQGVAGEIVSVADGFARNYLIPRGMAKAATTAAIEAHTELMEKVEARRAQYENMLNELARQIDGTELIFERRAASTGTLFGSVTTQDIADALDEATGVDINRRRISQQSLRELGEYKVSVRLGSEEAPVLNVIIVREGELQEFLAAREAAAEGEVIDPATLEVISEEDGENELPEPIPMAEDAEEIDNRTELQKTIDEAAEESGLVEDDEADGA